MDLYLLTNSDYSAVVGYAEHLDRGPNDFTMGDHRRVNAYGADQRPLFTRKGLSNAERRAYQLDLRLVTAVYFGIGITRPDDTSAPAYARQRAQDRAARRGGAA